MKTIQLNVRTDAEHKQQIADLVAEYNASLNPGEQKLTVSSFVLIAISREQARRRAALDRLYKSDPVRFPPAPKK